MCFNWHSLEVISWVLGQETQWRQPDCRVVRVRNNTILAFYRNWWQLFSFFFFLVVVVSFYCLCVCVCVFFQSVLCNFHPSINLLRHFFVPSSCGHARECKTLSVLGCDWVVIHGSERKTLSLVGINNNIAGHIYFSFFFPQVGQSTAGLKALKRTANEQTATQLSGWFTVPKYGYPSGVDNDMTENFFLKRSSMYTVILEKYVAKQQQQKPVAIPLSKAE